ncbi:hypothetical protein [uncultured Deinococcus sp.]|uniref:hypothetical protein n=1 Tax=uncultured Deinococcus sp. TaxID=158789 RepID=UPI0025EB0BAD|nr:hypothetical protein [uncultured Deinococcus sp.]
MTMITVQRMPQTIRFKGKTYGPSEKPIDVPEELARALGLPPVEGSTFSEVDPEALQEELSASRRLSGQYQERLTRLLDLLHPEQQGDELPDAVLDRLLRERQDARDALQGAQQVQRDLQGQLDAKGREAQHAVEQWTATTEELTQTRAALARAQEEGGAAQAQVATLTSELDTLRSQALLPGDALDRLKTVDGIGDKLALKALESLQAKE